SFGTLPYIQKKTEIQPDQWKTTVKQAVEEIKKGDIHKIVLARELNIHLSSEANIASMLDTFKRTQENSYIVAIEYNGDCFIGATPERLVRMDEEKILSTCLAGTIRRGTTQKEDEALGKELLNDRKNREEHD